MHTERLAGWQHEHVFGQDQKRSGENRTMLVVALTSVMMLIEIFAGIVYGSMALLADGLHMASHTVALGVAVIAYVVSRRLAATPHFAFGVGKINSLAGFASAVMLLGFALVMVIESVGRLMAPRPISFDEALIVATLGLLVNGISAWLLLSTPHQHDHQDHHDHQDDHDHHHAGHDHNLRAAYLHVLADALTSFLAIFALLAAKYFAANWLDPVMGIVGACLVARWSIRLIADSSRVLLDAQSDGAGRLRQAIEGTGSDRVSDLHFWEIGHDIFAAEVVIVSHEPASVDEYKARIPSDLRIAHVTVEIHRCD